VIILFHRIRVILRAEDSQSWCKLGVAYFKRGLWEKSLGALNHALILDPHNDHALEAKGDVHRGYGNAEAAVGCYHDAARLDLWHKNPHRWNKLGLAYSDLKKPMDAINAYRKALEHDAKNPNYWSNIITEYINAKKPNAVVVVCEEAIKQVPENASIWRDFAFALDQLGESKKAELARTHATKYQSINQKKLLRSLFTK
jgi:tetratricopeptide (TPR) repeat protein